jgi:hypothetical protein
MSTRRIVARPRSQAPRRRRRGRLSPTNGSVTRADVEAIYREFSLDVADPTADEFRRYLLGAIVDPAPSPRTRAKIAAAARAREARKRAERRAREQLAQPPSRALAAA